MKIENSPANATNSLRTLITREALQRLLITVAALAVYRFGAHWPAPGINPQYPLLTSKYVPLLSTSAIERLSLFSLGLSPILSVLIAAEVMKLAFPSLGIWLSRTSANRFAFNRWILIAGLGLTAFQACGVAIALERIHNTLPLVTEPGVIFRLQYVISAVAGAAFLCWLADQVTRHGIGSGLWIFILAPLIGGLFQTGVQMSDLYGQTQLSAEALLLLAVSIIAAVALLVGIEKARCRLPDLTATQPVNTTLWWPIFVALTLAGMASGYSVGMGNDLRDWSNWFAPGSPSLLALTVALIFFATFAMTGASRRNQRSIGKALAVDDVSANAAALVVAAAFSVICVALEIVNGKTFIGFIEGGWLAALVLVCLSILPDNLASYFPDPAPLIIEDETPGST
jgi:SecY